jgi:hypothetical protein
MFGDAIKAKEAQEKLHAMDLSELVAEALETGKERQPAPGMPE